MSDLKASCFKLSRARLQRSQKQTTGASRQRSAIRTSHQSSVDAAGDTELGDGKTSTGPGQCDVTVTSRFGLAPVTSPSHAGANSSSGDPCLSPGCYSTDGQSQFDTLPLPSHSRLLCARFTTLSYTAACQGS